MSNQYYKITGGTKLTGSISTNGAKNSAVGLLAASLINKGTTVLHNMPKIEEVYRLIEVLNSLNVQTIWQDNTLTIIPPKTIAINNLDIDAASKTRSIIMFIGCLIHHFSKFNLPSAGGCKLGKRTVKPHFFALEKFGINIKTTEKYYEITHKKLNPANDIILYEMGDTVTENAIMAAALVPGKSIIKFASANYQIQELCLYLKLCGVQITGIGTSTLIINGVSSINKKIEYHIAEDPIESMLFISLAATTNSSLVIKRCPIDFLSLELLKLEKMNFKYEIIKHYKSKNGYTNLVDIKTYPSKLIALEEKIHPQPYPGLNIDNLPFFVPIATQAKGQTLIHDWIYENRAIYYVELIRLGADIMLADPHRVFINGPTPLKGTEIVAPPALRPSAIVLVAMIAAKGDSILRNTYGIERGYENLVERLQSIGVQIQRVE